MRPDVLPAGHDAWLVILLNPFHRGSHLELCPCRLQALTSLPSIHLTCLVSPVSFLTTVLCGSCAEQPRVRGLTKRLNVDAHLLIIPGTCKGLYRQGREWEKW